MARHPELPPSPFAKSSFHTVECLEAIAQWHYDNGRQDAPAYVQAAILARIHSTLIEIAELMKS